VQIVVIDAPEHSFHVALHDEAQCLAGIHPNPAATLRAKTSQLLRLVEDPKAAARCDQDPALLEGLQGDTDLAVILAQAIKGEYAPGHAQLLYLRARHAAIASFASSVERIPELELSELRELLQSCTPVIFTAVLRDEPWRWSPAILRDRFGQLPLQRLDASVLGATNDCDTLGELIDRATAPGGRGSYSGGCALPEELRPFFRLPFFDPAFFTHPQLWLGRKGEEQLCTDLHRDFSHAFIAQVFGRKRFILFAPDQETFLYPGTCYNSFQSANVDPRHPDLARHPRFAAARSIELTLEPNELLVLPAGWFHAVYSTEPVMSVGRFLRRGAWDRLQQ
jgi:hypothetical protein